MKKKVKSIRFKTFLVAHGPSELDYAVDSFYSREKALKFLEECDEKCAEHVYGYRYFELGYGYYKANILG